MIMLRQTRGRLHQGQALTAGAIKNKQVLQEMVQRDDAYRLLKNVRGSPAYFQAVQYDVLAMIRQLGLPTWFLTLSAADMQWPDVIQTIARQYGTILSDEDVKTMPFEEKSKWLRQTPVTAARHFQYRLKTFPQKFLKSKAHPLVVGWWTTPYGSSCRKSRSTGTPTTTEGMGSVGSTIDNLRNGLATPTQMF